MPEVSGPTAAKIIGVDESTVRRYVYRGLLKARRAGLRKNIWVEIEDLREFATEQQFRFNEELAKQLTEE